MPSSQSSIPTHSIHRVTWSRCTQTTLTTVLTTNLQHKVTGTTDIVPTVIHHVQFHNSLAMKSEIASICFFVALNLLNSTQTCSFFCKTRISFTAYMEKLHGVKEKKPWWPHYRYTRTNQHQKFLCKIPGEHRSPQKFCHCEKPKWEWISILLRGRTSQLIVLCSLQYHCTL
jgi:hypothetical protein